VLLVWVFWSCVGVRGRVVGWRGGGWLDVLVVGWRLARVRALEVAKGAGAMQEIQELEDMSDDKIKHEIKVLQQESARQEREEQEAAPAMSINDLPRITPSDPLADWFGSLGGLGGNHPNVNKDGEDNKAKSNSKSNKALMDPFATHPFASLFGGGGMAGANPLGCAGNPFVGMGGANPFGGPGGGGLLGGAGGGGNPFGGDGLAGLMGNGSNDSSSSPVSRPLLPFSPFRKFGYFDFWGVSFHVYSWCRGSPACMSLRMCPACMSLGMSIRLYRRSLYACSMQLANKVFRHARLPPP
jgi:hypothetical protein